MTTVSVSFGGIQRVNDDITGGWIVEQQRAREKDGVPVCAIVRVQGPGFDVTLPVGQCGSGGGARRVLTPREQELIDLWRRLHLDGTEFSPGNLQAFVKQASRLS
jgi:hypothetical protein